MWSQILQDGQSTAREWFERSPYVRGGRWTKVLNLYTCIVALDLEKFYLGHLIYFMLTLVLFSHHTCLVCIRRWYIRGTLI